MTPDNQPGIGDQAARDALGASQQEFRYAWAEQEGSVIERSMSPRRVMIEARGLALYPFREGWIRRDKTPNTWPVENLTIAIDRRTRTLSRGSLGKDVLSSLFDYTPDQLMLAGVELSPERRTELIKALQQSYRELVYLTQIHEGVSQLRSADSDAAAEVGLFGHSREVINTLDQFDTLGRMTETFPGDKPFYRKAAISLRALNEVASGKTFLPRPFAEEPQRGIDYLTLGWMFRAVAGVEATERFWKESPNEQFKDPPKFFDQGRITVSLDDLNRGEIGRDYTPFERDKIQGDPGIPDIRHFEAEILADPKLADSLDACMLAWEMYILFRRSAYNAIKPADKTVKEGDEFNKFLEMDTGTPLWHVETTESIASLMFLNLRLIEEGIRDRIRWSGPVALLGVMPNGSAPVDMMVMITRNTDVVAELNSAIERQRKEAEDRLGRELQQNEVKEIEGKLKKQLPGHETQRLPISKFLFEGSVIDHEALERAIDLKKKELGRDLDPSELIELRVGAVTRPTDFADFQWTHLFLEDSQRELFEEIMGTKDSEGRDRIWDRPVMPRVDIELYQRLAQMYFFTLFMKQILKPEKGYAELAKAMGSVEWQKANAKAADVALLLLGLAFGLTVDESRRHADLTMANAFGAVIYENFGPRKAVKMEDRVKRVTTRRMPQAKVGDRVGIMAPDKDINAMVMDTFWAALDAGVFTQADLALPPELAETPNDSIKRKEDEIELERRMVNVLRNMLFVARNGLGVMPGDSPDWWSIDLQRGAQIAKKVADSGFYRPYHLYSRPTLVTVPLSQFNTEGEFPLMIRDQGWVKRGLSAYRVAKKAEEESQVIGRRARQKSGR